MAKAPKKKPPRKRASPKQKKAPPASTAELAGDAKNPRTIDAAAAAGLAKSIDRFGDLSGITFNTRTGELVTGHQRVAQIRAKYGDAPIEVDAATGRGWIRAGGEAFAIRVVDWSPAVQRAANVAANNAKIQGEFSEDLAAYLHDVEAELAEEMPGVLDDVLLAELIQTEEPQKKKSQGNKSDDPTLRFQVIVECESEEQQCELLDRFATEGLKCRALIS